MCVCECVCVYIAQLVPLVRNRYHNWTIENAQWWWWSFWTKYSLFFKNHRTDQKKGLSSCDTIVDSLLYSYKCKSMYHWRAESVNNGQPVKQPSFRLSLQFWFSYSSIVLPPTFSFSLFLSFASLHRSLVPFSCVTMWAWIKLHFMVEKISFWLSLCNRILNSIIYICNKGHCHVRS